MSKLKMSCLWGAASGTAILCALATIGTAHASGFQVRETSGTLQGSSFAGMSTLTTDASTMFYNPGSVGQFEETTYSVGGSLIVPRSELTSGKGTASGLSTGINLSRTDYDDMAVDAFVPNAHAVWKLTENLNLGMSITSPWGLVTDYENDFAGRYFGTTSAIKTVNLKPVLAYRFDNGLSIGAGPQIQYFEARFDKAVARGTGVEGNSSVRGDDTAMGWQAGLNWQILEKTRVGIAYNSEVKHTLKGKVDFDSAAEGLSYVDRDVTAKVATPEAIAFGISHDIGEKWTVTADAQWPNWHS
ncbi:MAG: long-chain fatty acid transporter, partial [Thalassospira sp.]|uniref:OmpP1/FadL family transporter n=1 Tax=Thalassospira sp. TaxID=1912094 RepID=UPI000C591344